VYHLLKSGVVASIFPMHHPAELRQLKLQWIDTVNVEDSERVARTVWVYLPSLIWFHSS
jgi:hypothetical protein